MNEKPGIEKEYYTVPVYNKHALRIGHFSDKYFLRTRDILFNDNYDHKVHYQYFQRKDNVILCGIKHVLDLYKTCTGYYKDLNKAIELFNILKTINPYNLNSKIIKELFDDTISELEDLWVDKFHEIEFHCLTEGTEINKMDICIGIIGNPKYFIHLETPTLGILAQQSAVSTSVRQVIKRLNKNQELLFFPARFRHYLSQMSDGYAAVVGGVKAMSTDANGEYSGLQGIGTIPHVLIASYGGLTSLAALKFDEYIDPSINRTILVDWDNDCIKTTLECLLLLFDYADECTNKTFLSKEKINLIIKDYSKYLKQLSYKETLDMLDIKNSHKSTYTSVLKNCVGEGKGKIYGIRFDTSGTLIDSQVSKNQFNFGVCSELVFKARETFDSLGLGNLKIIVSGGFDIEKIELFQKMKVPVDMFGIGSSIVNKYNTDFTADAVTLDGKHNAKVGRSLGDWSKLIRVI